MKEREQIAKELAGNKTKYTEREKQIEEDSFLNRESCLNCIHREICDEINKLPCREQFVWYKGETGCPHHLAAVDIANAVIIAKTLFPGIFGKKEISCGCKEERIVRTEEKP